MSAVASLSAELALNLFGFAAVVAMLAAPLIAMRMLSAEFRDGSFDLIGSAPVHLYSVVLGKFLGVAALLTPLCLLPALNVTLLDRHRRPGPRALRGGDPGAAGSPP